MTAQGQVAVVSFTVRASAPAQRSVHVAPAQSRLQAAVQVTSHTAPPRHCTLLEPSTVTVQLLSSSQLTFELAPALTLQSLPVAQSVLQESPQVTSQLPEVPQSKLQLTSQVLVQLAADAHTQLAPVHAQLGPGQALPPAEQPSEESVREVKVMTNAKRSEDMASKMRHAPPSDHGERLATRCAHCVFRCAGVACP